MELRNETLEAENKSIQNFQDEDLLSLNIESIVEPDLDEKRITIKRNVLLWLVGLMIFLAIFIISAIKNPSEKDGKEMVNQFIVERINDKLRTDIDANKDDGFTVIGGYIGMALIPKIVDYIIDTKVSDYVVLSTFKCTAETNDEPRNMLSGIIVFGKVIPLDSDLKDMEEFKNLIK